MKTGICVFSGDEVSTVGQEEVVQIKGDGQQFWLALWSEFCKMFMQVIEKEAAKDDAKFDDEILGLETIKHDRLSPVVAEFDARLFKQGAPIGQMAILINALHPWANDLVGYLNSASADSTGIMGNDSEPSSHLPKKKRPSKKHLVQKRPGKTMRRSMAT